VVQDPGGGRRGTIAPQRGARPGINFSAKSTSGHKWLLYKCIHIGYPGGVKLQMRQFDPIHNPFVRPFTRSSTTKNPLTPIMTLNWWPLVLRADSKLGQ
jgi:hypothetical protein